ncbi:MAG: hypothetical protein GTO14_17550 [Anaerolineales bacterium]|nr:hypothetical protein [Anaerolineales bacterium]
MNTCPSCKSPVDEGDHFCSSCGAGLALAKAQTTLGQFIKTLAERYNLAVEFPRRPGYGWRIDLPPRGEFICQLAIGSKATDWYANVLDRYDRHKVWTDWMDYYGYDKKSEDQLVDDKQRDIAWFVGSWIAATALRVSQESVLWGLKKRTILEWNHSGAWEQVQLCDPAR